MLIKETENVKIYMYNIEIEHTGHFTNMYIIKDKKTNKLAVIDPAFDGNRIREESAALGILECVIVTHSHADHIAGLAKLVNDTEVKVYVHKLDIDGLYSPELNEENIVGTKIEAVDRENVVEVEENDVIQLGDVELMVMHTPGHTKGAMCVYSKKENVLFSGDTIFKTSYGRTDLITGNVEDMGKTLDKIFNTFENIFVCPGHGETFELEESKRKIKLIFAFNK